MEPPQPLAGISGLSELSLSGLSKLSKYSIQRRVLWGEDLFFAKFTRRLSGRSVQESRQTLYELLYEFLSSETRLLLSPSGAGGAIMHYPSWIRVGDIAQNPVLYAGLTYGRKFSHPWLDDGKTCWRLAEIKAMTEPDWEPEKEPGKRTENFVEL